MSLSFTKWQQYWLNVRESFTKKLRKLEVGGAKYLESLSPVIDRKTK